MTDAERKRRAAEAKLRRTEAGFKTLVDAKDFFRGMRDTFVQAGVTPGGYLPQLYPNQDAWLLWLLAGHPAYARIVAQGVNRFTLHANGKLGLEGWGISAVDNTGVEHKIGIPVALSGNYPTQKTRLINALRNEVQYQKKLFRENFFAQKPSPVCPVTAVVMVITDVELDHLSPAFIALAETFIEQEGGHVEVTDPTKVDALLDRGQASRWQGFHWGNVRYEVLSKKGHALRTAERRGLSRSK